MAIRNLRFEEDEILRKQSRKVEEINENVIMLIDDMIETMYKMGGVGLAAPQVGILKRIIVIDIGDGPIVLINPEVVERVGEQTVTEGCLSVPGVTGEIIRPKTIKVKGLNKEGKEIIIEGKDVLSQALEHEIDHLNGILFIDKVIRIIEPKEE